MPYFIFLISILLVACRPADNLPSGENPVIEELHSTPVPQSSPTNALPTRLSTSSPVVIEPTIETTPGITQTVNFETERTFNFGAERIYDFWGERLAISPDEQWLAVITVNHEIGLNGVSEYKWEEVRIYNYQAGKQQHILQRTISAPQTYNAMAFSPDSKWLAVGGTEQIIWVWDIISGDLAHHLPFWGPITDLAFSPDGRLLTAVSPSEDPDESGVGVFDVETETLINQISEREATNVTFLENGTELLIGAAVYYHPDREVGDALFIWNYETNAVAKVLSQYGEPRVVAINHEKGILAVVIENTLHLIELQSHVEIDVEMPEFSARAMSFDTAGNLWALGFDGLLSQWNTDGELIRQQRFVDATDLAVMPKTGHLLISFPDQIWEVSFGE